MRVLALCLLALLIAPATARADGKFFGGERIPPELPYQRAVIHFDDGVETLFLQSAYRFPRDPTDFGWVVPLPSVPEIGVLPREEGDSFFWSVDRATWPFYIHGSMLAILLFLGFCAYGTILCIRGMPNFVGVPLVVLGVVFGAAFVTLLIPQGSPSRGERVQVESVTKVGPYEVTVIRGDDGADILDWLRKNGFRYGSKDRKSLDAHAKRGFCFCATKIVVDRERRSARYGGMNTPLVLRFPVDKPVYPLALTATAGTETEVLLYVLAPHRMGCGERMPTLHAEPFTREVHDLLETAEPAGFLAGLRFDGLWITKMKARLTPEEMREDLVLHEVEDDSFRQIRLVW